MKHPHDRFGLDVLVELIATEQSQSIDGSPIERIEPRLSLSLGLARRAGLGALVLHLDRRDFAWLCNARVVDRLSSAANAMKIDGVQVVRAKPGLESHISGTCEDDREPGIHPFPLIGDPSLIPDFVQHVPSEAEKAEMLARFQAAALETALNDGPGHGTLH